MAAATLPDSPPPSPRATKTVLGKYQLGRVLGRGSFAKVYFAKSINDNKSVAIKVIDKLKTDPSIYPRIADEVSAMGRLDHPNILRIHEVLASKQNIYMVMELAKGGDLFGKLARRADHRFPEPLARRYLQQVVSALHYCHCNGVAHRDVKPQNLLLDSEGNVKVADFGLARIVESPLNKHGMLKTACGTPAFAGPEIVGRTRGGYDGSKADAWSCGVILFVMLSGYLPFDDGNLVLMYRKMVKREYRFPSWVSKPARLMISRLLDPNPKTRMSIEQVMDDPWLINSGKIYPRSVSLGDMALSEEQKYEVKSMNAFEIISMSSGLDLSGLFEGKERNLKKEKRFTSRESKGVVVEKVVEVGVKLGYEVEKREKGASLDGGCCVWLGKGRLVMSIAIVEVAVGLIVVEVRVVDGSVGGWDMEDSPWGEIKIGLGDIAVSWQNV